MIEQATLEVAKEFGIVGGLIFLIAFSVLDKLKTQGMLVRVVEANTAAIKKIEMFLAKHGYEAK